MRKILYLGAEIHCWFLRLASIAAAAGAKRLQTTAAATTILSIAFREPHRRKTLVLLVTVQAFILLLLLLQPNFEARLEANAIRPDNGYAYRVELKGLPPWGYRIDSDRSMFANAGLAGIRGKPVGPALVDYYSQSTLIVLQDDRPLGPANALLARIRADGGGSFSHWEDALYFSTPDNTDPRIDGHAYSIRAELTLNTWLSTTLLSAFVAIAAVLFWMCRQWLQTHIHIGHIKLTALVVMLAMAPWAWSGPIVWMWDFLSASGNYALLGSYLLLVVATFAGLGVAPFLQNDRLRSPIAIILLAGFAADRSIFALSGEHSTLQLMQTLVREYREASSAYSTYGYTIGVNCIIPAMLLVTFMMRPPDGWKLRSRYSVLIFGALIGAIGLTRISSYAAYGVPSPLAVPAQLLVSPFYFSDEGREPAPIQYAGAFEPAFKKVIMVVDESVRGDYLGLNNPAYDNTPYLRSASDAIINFGVATSTHNCSAPSRLIMRLGLQPWQLPDTKESWKRAPSIWQYAHKAGFKTVFIDAFKNAYEYHSYMGPLEARMIDVWSKVPYKEVSYEKDPLIAEALIDVLKNEGPMLIYVNKLGIHFPYYQKYPHDIRYDSSSLVSSLPLDAARRRIVADYHKAIRWSVDEFFAKVLPVIGPDTLLIYTSDHGQALFEGGYDFQHCSFTSRVHPGEAMVPLFISAGPGRFAERLKKQASIGFNEATLFEVFPTLLLAMGYAEDWVSRAYGPSLLQFPLGKPREMLIGEFFDPGAFWVNIDEKIQKEQLRQAVRR